jgi:hypothetical protein
VSKEAKEWVDDHVHYDDHQMIGKGIAIEPRYLEPIVEAMLNEGFTNGEDFTLYC